ncbi:MAG: hypothetical protein JW986_07125 [Methanotrichaceae archaeon]|nr:hypothetical protein [Methanotrichaceae archaeon]
MKDEQAKRSRGSIETSPLQAPAFQALTIGIPFSLFKLLFGVLCIRMGADSVLVVFGALVIIWASADLAMNVLRAAFDLAGRMSPVEFCTIAQVGRLIGRPRVFLAIDTLVSFSIICAVLWSGWIANLRPNESILWYAATTLNLISISLVALSAELHRAS